MTAPVSVFRVGSLVLASLLLGCGRAPAPVDPTSAAPAAGQVIETTHFALHTTAGADASARASAAVEALHQAYARFFDGLPPAAAGSQKLKLRLYASRADFRANSRGPTWAEAYYHQGVCHAYLDEDQANPYHWLLHEAVHQLNREVLGHAKDKWINEGLATYFGSSRYAAGRLEPGVPDFGTYPLWWLDDWELTGDWMQDVEAQRVVPLRALITGQGGPPIAATVNAHYLGYWSLTHFLLHHDGGRYAAGYRELIRSGGTLADFERHVAALDQVEGEWYAYVQGLVASRRSGIEAENRVPLH